VFAKTHFTRFYSLADVKYEQMDVKCEQMAVLGENQRGLFQQFEINDYL
jgi:hypothetical protein